MSENRFALLVACDCFRDSHFPELKAPIADARALKGVLEDPKIGQFDVKIVENPTREILADQLSEFFDNRGPEDVLLLYLAGHGALDDRRNFYFVTTNTRGDRLHVNGLPDTLIHQTMMSSGARSQILILDCCYSGAFAKSLVPRGDGTVGIRRKLAGQGRVILTASDSLEYAYERTMSSGETTSLFTSRIVEGLRHGYADLDGDGFIWIDELYHYVADRIHQEDPSQKPLLSSLLDGRLWVGKAAARLDSVPREIIDLLQHTRVAPV